MGGSSFTFRQFVIRQEHCAMKVGTDGTLLGAWARGGLRVLDVGTGTGLLALMIAQRYPDAEIVAIDIDEMAVRQAAANVAASPFASRISVACMDLLRHSFICPFDSIVCNPPYFSHSLTSPDGRRTMARHTGSLPYNRLMQECCNLLSEKGELSLIVPTEGLKDMEAEAALAGLHQTRRWAVRTTPQKHPRRWLLAFGKHRPAAGVEEGNGVIEDRPGHRSDWYSQLTADFYL